MLTLDNASRWRVRLVGFAILISLGLILNPIDLRSQEQPAPMAPAQAQPEAVQISTPVVLENASYAPGRKLLVGTVGETLPGAVRVRATGEDGAPLPGVAVTFEFVSKPSKVRDAGITPMAVSGPDGIAAVDVILGDKDGSYLITARSEHMAGEMPQIKVVSLKPTWWIFLTFGLVGGLGLFLYGMELGSGGLQKVAGNRMRQILGALTTNRFMGVGLGTIVTGLVQSSSATTVMVVGFVSAGLMTLVQAIGVIMGANIGTTLTVQLIAFKITDYALLMIGAGFVMTIATKRKTYTYIGEIILGFGMIFYGMAVMSDAMRPLRSMPMFSDTLLSLGDQPLLGIIAAAVFTGIIQSSGATIGLAVVLAGEGLIDLNAAMPIVLGANIGTTATTLLAMVGASQEGKRAGVAHLLFNIIGVLIFFPFLTLFVPMVVDVTHWMGSDSAMREVANGHMIFNVIVTVVFLPFLQPLAWLVNRLVPKGEEAEEEEVRAQYLNNNLLETPDLALTAAYQEILRVSGMVGEMIRRSLEAFGENGEEARKWLHAQQDDVDGLCDELRGYHVRLSQKNLGLTQSREKNGQMSIVDDFRQMSDEIGGDIEHRARVLAEDGIHFSGAGYEELGTYLNFTLGIHSDTVAAMQGRDVAKARLVRKRKDEGEEHEHKLRDSHLERLDQGLAESVETSTAHMDMLTGFRQMGRHHFRICRLLEDFLNVPD